MVGWRSSTMEAAMERFLAFLTNDLPKQRARESLDGWDAWIEAEKVGGARGVAAAALQAWGRDPERLREYTLLSWQTERLLPVVLPLAGCAYYRDGVLHSQLHAARWTEHEGTLAAAVARHDPRCEAWLSYLGRETARLHTLRCYHGNLAPERILIAAPGALQPLVWCGSGLGSLRQLRPNARPELDRVLQHLAKHSKPDSSWPSGLLHAYRAARATLSPS